MPFTPFHFGPGTLVKAVMPRWFSLTVFRFSQVLIDFETLTYILRREPPLHRFFHTYAGATFIAVGSYILGRPICGIGLAFQSGRLRWTRAAWTDAARSISRTACLTAAVIGAWSHVVLDSIMHADVRPLAPFSNANPHLEWLDPGELHAYCVLSGIIGLAGMAFWWMIARVRREG